MPCHRLPRVQRLQTHPVLQRVSIRIFVQAGSATIQLKRPGLMSLGIISCLMFLAESLLEVFEGCQSMSKLMSILYNCMVFLEFFSCKVRHVKFRSFHLRWSQLQLHTWQVSITGMNASWLQPQTAEVPGWGWAPQEYELQQNKQADDYSVPWMNLTWQVLCRSSFLIAVLLCIDASLIFWTSLRWWRILEIGSIHWFIVSSFLYIRKWLFGETHFQVRNPCGIFLRNPQNSGSGRHVQWAVSGL